MAWGLAASIPAAARILWDGALSSAWRRRPQNMHADNPEDKSASLILCVHNDLDHLQTIWPLWRGQVFPKDWNVQWVIVNDGSTDGTQQWLSQQLAKDANPSLIVLVNHQKSRPGKKEALTKGIEAARCDRLVLTDVDCRPGPDWAKKASAKHAGGGLRRTLNGRTLFPRPPSSPKNCGATSV